MVRGQKRKELLSPSEIQSLQDEKRELEATKQEIAAGAGDGRMNAASLDQQIRKIDDAIQERTPDKPSGVQKDRLWKEEKELEERIAEGMPSRYEMRKPTENPGAVRKHMEWCRRNQADIERYVQIQRTLRPQEPKSIEVLRREK